MITDEEFDFIAERYFARIRRLGTSLMNTTDGGILDKVEKMNETLERIKEIRTIQRRQRGEEE